MKHSYLYFLAAGLLGVSVLLAASGRIGALRRMPGGPDSAAGSAASVSSAVPSDSEPCLSAAASSISASSSPASAAPQTSAPVSSPGSRTSSVSSAPASSAAASSAAVSGPAPTSGIKIPFLSTPIVLDDLAGASEASVRADYGNPAGTEADGDGYIWNMYHDGYRRFVMIGIGGGMVQAVYSNSADFRLFGIRTGMDRNDVRSRMSADFGEPVTRIRRGNAYYPVSHTDEKDVFAGGDAYYTFYYDLTDGYRLTSVRITGRETEESAEAFPEASDAIASAMEKITFHLVNAIRVDKGLPAFRWSAELCRIARAHSRDMFIHDYFSHTGPDGLNAAGRLDAAGVAYTDYAENIAYNHTDPVDCVENLMNSEGHRDNILFPSGRAGIGIFIGDGRILQTQLFVR